MEVGEAETRTERSQEHASRNQTREKLGKREIVVVEREEKEQLRVEIKREGRGVDRIC